MAREHRGRSNGGCGRNSACPGTIFREACQVAKAGSRVRSNLRTRLLEMVERHTFLSQGRVCCHRPSEVFYAVPIETTWNRYRQFYVHPATGVLCEIHRVPRSKSYWEERRRQILDHLKWLDHEQVVVRIGGCWFMG